ncbi:hypothetical protein DER29_0511 [Micromonospora sp. M71_S20]|uniref:hypothetical protein n=1 Tax=Micromonospora sp. M71_S20 TaxID=592872 RepID=UPI000F144B23|nr:hypothetical protein [Micromonospora sp. M71_S20]RLK22672.1 hypothetical protein DER29_0511 [Micromonospora sp. M71_S20]
MDVFETDNFPTNPDTREGYDLLDFEARDDLDDAYADDLRAVVTGLPARPGTRR